MQRQCKAKIVATLGPASSTPEVIRDLLNAGADVFRLNFSHGSHDEHRRRYEILRALEREAGRPIGVLADLQGPKLRIGTLASGPIELGAGERLRFDLDPTPGSRERVPLPHPEVFTALAPGVQLLLDDGKIRLEVEEATGERATARVLVAGPLSERKGVSVVGAVLPVSALTAKDRRDWTSRSRSAWTGLPCRSSSDRRTWTTSEPSWARGREFWPSWRSRRPSLGSTRSLPVPMP
jgi:pyruvate kinase